MGDSQTPAQCVRFTGMDLREESRWVPKRIKSGIKVVFWDKYQSSLSVGERFITLPFSQLSSAGVFSLVLL